MAERFVLTDRCGEVTLRYMRFDESCARALTQRLSGHRQETGLHDIVIGDPHQLSAEVIGEVLEADRRVLVVSFRGRAPPVARDRLGCSG